MDKKLFANSELIINPDGSIYHLNLKPEQLARNIILVGDPQRVEEVSANFDEIEIKTQNREIRTHTGYYKGQRITALSTGMGTDNIDIVINELDALVNIDLETRTLKTNHESLNLIRIGTSGALQADIKVNTPLISAYGLGIDGLAYFYSDSNKVVDRELTNCFKKHMTWKDELAYPYGVAGSERLIEKIGQGMMQGITLTAPGFYGPQGRTLRLNPSWPAFFQHIGNFTYSRLKIINFEMETSALYALSKMLGHEALTVCMAIANRETGDYSRDYKTYMRQLIRNVLGRLTD